MEYLLGFDIGGTKTEVSLFSIKEENGELEVSINGKIKNLSSIVSKRMPTSREQGYEAYLENLKDLTITILKEKNLKVDDIFGIGLGLPGSVHPQTNIMLNGNTKMMIGKDPAADLRSLLSYRGKFAVNNDASCFALAESLCGAGLKYQRECGVEVSKQQSIGIILGTGCGGGLIANGKILNGAKGGGGEIGHLTLITNGLSCYCGRLGCAEQYLSGPSLEASLKRNHGETLAASEIFELAKSGNKNAESIIQDYCKKLTDFLINLNNIYDPHYFVLGGGVSKQNIIYQGIEDLIVKEMFVSGDAPKVYQHQISDSSGVLGAAIMVL